MSSYIIKFIPLFGFQSTSQVEVENWIHCIHSAAASAFARQRGSSDVVKVLTDEINSIELKITDDEKLKKMAELQSKVVTDARNKQTIVDQVSFCFLQLTFF